MSIIGRARYSITSRRQWWPYDIRASRRKQTVGMDGLIHASCVCRDREAVKPWLLEGELIKMLSLPLNLDQNKLHFRARLTALRSQARKRALELPVLTVRR